MSLALPLAARRPCAQRHAWKPEWMHSASAVARCSCSKGMHVLGLWREPLPGRTLRVMSGLCRAAADLGSVLKAPDMPKCTCMTTVLGPSPKK